MLTVSEMNRLVWGSASGRRITMVLRAAFDASKECPQGTTAVAGYIAEESKWQEVEDRWNGQLVLAGLSEFHLTPIRHRFRDLWLEVVKPFAQIAKDVHLRSLTSLLRDTDWDGLDHPPEYRKICPHREHACLDMLFGVLAEDVRLEFGNEPVTVVFDNDYGNREAIVRIHDAWCARTGHPGFNIFLRGGVPWGAVPLQCADMVAGLLRRSSFSEAFLDREFDKLDDSSELMEVASLALDGGRGAMWSAAVAADVEEALRQRKAARSD